MNTELVAILNRADELVRDLEAEFASCLRAEVVSYRARNLTDEALVKLRSALDHAMNVAWTKHIAPYLTAEKLNRARVYFPIASDINGFQSILGRAMARDLEHIHKPLYDVLLAKQPFTSDEHKWLAILTALAGEGKHVRLSPQKKEESVGRITVANGEGGLVSWNPANVKFSGSGVEICGAPVNSKTQRIEPTPGVKEVVEVWVSFRIEPYGVDALAFCKEACVKTKALVGEIMTCIGA